MDLNLQKYDHIEFNKDEKINKKIRAYMILFDYEALMSNWSDEQKVVSLKDWEDVFLKEEFYEIIPCVIYRRKKLEKRIKHAKMSVVFRMAHKLSDILQDIIKSKKDLDK